MIHNLTVIRPSDANEVKEAWKAALLNKKGPTALLFTRQNLVTIDRSIHADASGLHDGAYILWESSKNKPDIILIGTGSEVEIVLEAAKKLSDNDVNVRVVSMPSWELFEKKSDDYKELVLPKNCLKD